MVNDVDDPVQPLAVGVTVIVAVIGDVVLLIAVKAGIFPLPFAARPIAVLLFVQSNVVPATVSKKLTTVVDELLQTVWLLMEFTVGIGLTVIVILPLAVSFVRHVALDVNITDTTLPFARVELVNVLLELALP